MWGNSRRCTARIIVSFLIVALMQTTAVSHLSARVEPCHSSQSWLLSYIHTSFMPGVSIFSSPSEADLLTNSFYMTPGCSLAFSYTDVSITTMCNYDWGFVIYILQWKNHYYTAPVPWILSTEFKV